ncbi:hypothetical protein GCM10008994_05040 [Halorubrum ejinorense]|uniref:Uncharacterized protein n=1 Tax=Halorubrum ejinorense TaxID=425309 RepID=A0AAV3SNZ0_9EURY
MRYELPDTDEVRVVTVPMASEDEIPTGTLHSIADLCGADDFHARVDRRASLIPDFPTSYTSRYRESLNR